MDDLDCGSFFDHIDDLIEFPPENECVGVGSGDCNNFPSIWNDPLPDSEPLFSGSHNNSASDLSAELSVPYEDIIQLEWLSTFVEDSFSGGGLTLGKENAPVNMDPPHNKFQTSSPVSRARSKRPRPATFNPRPAIQLISPTSSFTEAPQPFVVAPAVSSESENFAESPMKKLTTRSEAPEQKKKKKIKFTIPIPPMDTSQNQNQPPQAIRKCMHCEITKTPQWRAGPMGPKTLCNACGVRYKSGRLFPEYRPAASPTFIPSLHSNSHKKVIEMRSKVGVENTAITETPSTPQPAFNPSNNPSVEF
nr:GATA transcription factor 8-like [Ipomoea batatas]